MSSKDNNTNSTIKINYEEILEEEIISSYEHKYGVDFDLKNKRFYRLRRTTLEIINRLTISKNVGAFKSKIT